MLQLLVAQTMISGERLPPVRARASAAQTPPTGTHTSPQSDAGAPGPLPALSRPFLLRPPSDDSPRLLPPPSPPSTPPPPPQNASVAFRCLVAGTGCVMVVLSIFFIMSTFAALFAIYHYREEPELNLNLMGVRPPALHPPRTQRAPAPTPRPAPGPAGGAGGRRGEQPACRTAALRCRFFTPPPRVRASARQIPAHDVPSVDIMLPRYKEPWSLFKPTVEARPHSPPLCLLSSPVRTRRSPRVALGSCRHVTLCLAHSSPQPRRRR